MSTEEQPEEPEEQSEAEVREPGDTESDATHPVPSRDNVLEFLHEADIEDDLEQAGYWVQRSIAETLLLLHDQRR